MAKLDQYRQLIQNLLKEYSEIQSIDEDVEAQIIFDAVG